MRTVISKDGNPNTFERSKERSSMKNGILTRDTPKIEVIGARISIAAAVVVLLLLASLHILSPEFDPSFRMVSEYALGHYGWVLSLMFLAWGISSCALAVAIWSQVKTKAGKVGLWFLVIAGLGEAMASVFDITHDPGHSIAGVLGIGGFPIAAVLLSVSLGRLQAWRDAKKPLLWIANLSWISVVLLGASLVLMTVQFAQVNGGQLPQHAPTQLPAGGMGRQTVCPLQLPVAADCRPAGDEAGRPKVVSAFISAL